MRGTLVLRTAFNVATHDETRGFIIYISSEMKVDGRGNTEIWRQKICQRQFFNHVSLKMIDFIDVSSSFFFFSKLNESENFGARDLRGNKKKW